MKQILNKIVTFLIKNINNPKKEIINRENN